eukprot:scaffold128082_cov25-Tisochrysis_lutea.AAC.3
MYIKLQRRLATALASTGGLGPSRHPRPVSHVFGSFIHVIMRSSRDPPEPMGITLLLALPSLLRDA